MQKVVSRHVSQNSKAFMHTRQTGTGGGGMAIRSCIAFVAFAAFITFSAFIDMAFIAFNFAFIAALNSMAKVAFIAFFAFIAFIAVNKAKGHLSMAKLQEQTLSQNC